MACTTSIAVGVAGVGDGCAGVLVGGSEVGLVVGFGVANLVWVLVVFLNVLGVGVNVGVGVGLGVGFWCWCCCWF